MLTEYVSKQEGWNLIEICEDDGYSGTSFDRPGVRQLLEDAKSGKINLILCKDLSRFGRNYIKVGQYIDYIFPSFNIRFIALSDNVDTLDRNSSAMDLMPVMNLFNEWHAANTSKKVRSVMAANSRQGKYLAAFAAYGYIKSDDEKHTPLIDEEAAVIVRRIFEQRAIGLSPKQIAKQLNKDGVPIPSDHRYHLKGKENPLVTAHLWNDCMVRGILNNEIYIGNLAQQRVTTVSYKNHKQIHKDRSEWIIVENTHELIISRELWDKVREVGASVSVGKVTKEGVIRPLSGFMYCPDCGYKMKSTKTKHTTKKRGTYETVSYRCGTYLQSGMDGCTPYSILERVISQVVVDDIRAKARLAVEDEDALRETIRKRRQAAADAESCHNMKELREGEERLAQLETLISKTYEEKLLKLFLQTFACSLHSLNLKFAAITVL
jgi:DNA invertase Pin-like site-specific DNA recombinase